MDDLAGRVALVQRPGQRAGLSAILKPTKDEMPLKWFDLFDPTCIKPTTSNHTIFHFPEFCYSKLLSFGRSALVLAMLGGRPAACRRARLQRRAEVPEAAGAVPGMGHLPLIGLGDLF